MAANTATDTDPGLAFFKALAETRNYSLGEPVAAAFTPDAKTVVFLRGGARDPVLRLYELQVASGRVRELVTPERLSGGAQEQLSAEEKARRERARVSTRGFTRYEMSKDGARVLVVLSGKLFVIDRQTLHSTALPGEGWIDPRFSPDGRFVAAVAGNELHVIDLASNTSRAVTSGATHTLHHGVAEFVAQEEMGRQEGYWWSPEGSTLAYQENDESGVEVRHIADPLHPDSPPQANFYPRAGTANTRVRLGIVARAGGPTQWVDWDREAYPYLARVNWEDKAAPLTILVQNRAQQAQVLLAVDPATGTTRELLRETDAAWLELDAATLPVWVDKGRRFLWTTERDGAWRVELRGADGAFERFLTPPDFGYRKLVTVDERRQAIYVLGGSDPREVQLWRFPIAGGDGTQQTMGMGAHGAVFSKDHRFYLHSYDLFDGRTGVEVIDSREGKVLRQLPSVTELLPFRPRVELLRTGGSPSFDAAVIRPRQFEAARRYPVILYVYAGPTSKRVNATLKPYVLDQWMADQGYVVVRIDNRGTPWHGRAWSRAVRGNLIDIALEDQIAGLKALAARFPEMDLGRVGVTGWSFGGYFTAMATIRRPDIFRSGVAGAPVITWENYDTHYTERYLGLPQASAEAYRISNVTTYAAQLERPLLLIHGLTDDNVYAQHALQLCEALFQAGKPYEFLPMLGTHMISDPTIRLRQQQRIMEFFGRTLR